MYSNFPFSLSLFQTCAVDIFSAGCVFYYVLTKGKHPFGDTLHRQANILSGEYDLNQIEDNLLAVMLIKQMIDFDPFNRPTASAILQYPIFWSKAKILSFFQDVSDRIEKEDVDNVVLKKLENNGLSVVKQDWRFQIDSEVATSLRKFRNYQGNRVRDLIRALRNKKHHYRELSEQVQKHLGDIPDSFVVYWTSRFPLLLIHTWLTMQCIKYEPVFSCYYDKNYNFIDLPKQDYLSSSGGVNSDGGEFDSKVWMQNKLKETISYEQTKSRHKFSESDSRGEKCDNNNHNNFFEYIDLSNSFLNFKSEHFITWLKSDFKDYLAFSIWLKCEMEKVVVDDDEDKIEDYRLFFVMNAELSLEELQDKFRLLVLENPNFFGYHLNKSPKKNKFNKKYYQKKKFNKSPDEKLTCTLTT